MIFFFFHFLLFLGSRHLLARARTLGGRVRDAMVARPQLSFTEVGEEVDSSTPRSLVFPRKIRGPTATFAASVMSLQLGGTDRLSRWDGLLKRPGMPSTDRYQQSLLLGDQLLEDLLKEQALFSWCGTWSAGATLRRQVIYMVSLES